MPTIVAEEDVMCEHEGQECPGRGCRCDCMNCPGHGSRDDDDEEFAERIRREAEAAPSLTAEQRDRLSQLRPSGEQQ